MTHTISILARTLMISDDSADISIKNMQLLRFQSELPCNQVIAALRRGERIKISATKISDFQAETAFTAMLDGRLIIERGGIETQYLRKR